MGGLFMSIEISAGKLRGLKMLSDADGRFRMMAVDQRGSLVRKLAGFMNKDESEITYDDLATVKASITKVLSPYSTATLMDPVYGYPYSIAHIPKDIGFLLSFEETGYVKASRNERERLSRSIEGWSVEKAKRAGADAIKLLLYYRPETSSETLEHQQKFCKEVGAECKKHDMPLLLETVGYVLLDDEVDSDSVFAKRKPGIVAQTAAEFSKPEYGVDILKLEFPANLKYTAEYADGKFDGEKREPVYDLDDVKGFCKDVDDASEVPWVILSAGVDIDEFAENVRIATAAGASGFLCGRAIWQDCLPLYPDVEAMEDYLAKGGAENFKRINNIYKQATPLFEHKKFGSPDAVKLEDGSEGWHIKY
jgi:tagatose 1,6-diphosphate aldolase